MSDDFERLGPPPKLFPCDPLMRQFPSAWRDIVFRRLSVQTEDGTTRYTCPICKRHFDHTDVGDLQGDHIWPYSLLGESTWENYQLICGNCNARKRDFVDREIRALLGHGVFRKQVCDFLRSAVSNGKLDGNDMARLLLGRDAGAETVCQEP